MTYEKLTEIIEFYNIPKDVVLQSDSGWEIDATNMDGVFYNPETNTIVFTMDMDDTRYMYHKEPWAKLEPWEMKVKEAYAEYENESTYFNAYKVNDNLYVVHGEITICGFDQNFDLLWEFVGHDIFVTQDGTQVLNFAEDYILVTDWLGKQYKLGYDGKPIL